MEPSIGGVLGLGSEPEPTESVGKRAEDTGAPENAPNSCL